MIVLPDEDGLAVFSQEAHAHLAGEMAARLPARDWEASALVAAARLHDNGWREADLAPTVDEAGRPHTFYRVPPDVYVAVWRRGIARAAGVDALVGLLVGLHGARFFAASPQAEVQALHEEERARQDVVLAELGLGQSWRALPAAIRSASDWIAFLDQLSLMICGEFGDTIRTGIDGTPHRAVQAGEVITLDPWPFTGEGWTVSIAGRRLSRHSYPSADSLREALAAAPLITRVRSVRPRAVTG